MEVDQSEVTSATDAGLDTIIEAVSDDAEMMEVAPAIQATVEQVGENDARVDDPYFGTYTWTISDISKKEAKGELKLYSEKFDVGTYIWRLLVFLKGNKANHISAYLDAPEAAITPLHMSPKASFKLVLLNQLDESKSYTKEANHTFTSHETDWGFTTFVALDELYDPRKGYYLNDSIVLRVEIHVQRDEKLMYDSRKETGYVGLKNQGATCYMNSLLQYLYNIPYFRKAVYHMPTLETDEANKSLPLALQSLFYKLQYSHTSVSTKSLTKSFGWGTYDAFMQHDVQELNRVLCEKLEEKMKGTKVERVINELFEGHTISFVECRNVDYKSTRRESFMDLQLDVKGCADVYDSFSKYCEVEELAGPNQYNAEGYGLQDARKGVLFEDFPPVLQLQLKRFEYDFQRDTMVKINDKYEFPTELDLDYGERKFMSESADPTVRNLYKLHSVLVHSGGVHGGHYYAFIRPDGQQWLKFDDDRVTLEDDNRAIKEQYGGGDDGILTTTTGYGHGPIRSQKYSSAYMLVYVRVSDWDRIMCSVGRDDIEDYLRERLDQEQAEKEKRQKEKQEAHLYCIIKVALEEDLRQQVGKERFFDLVDHDKLPPERIYRVRKNLKFSEFKQQVAQQLGIAPHLQRYWCWSKRENQSYRPSRPLKPEEEDVPIMDLRDLRELHTSTFNKSALMDIALYLEVPRENKPALHKISKMEILLFFKVYDPVNEQLSYIGQFYAPKNSKMTELVPAICRLANWADLPEVECYEEIRFDADVMCEKIDLRKTLAAAQLDDGDIICVQRALDPEAAAKCRYPKVKQFLEYTRNRKQCTFKKLDEPQEAGITLELSRNMSYDEVTQELASAIGVPDPTTLRLTQYSTFTHSPQKQSIRYRSVARLEQMLTHGSHSCDILYYEVLDLPLTTLEQLKTLRVAFYSEKVEMVSEHQLRLTKDGTVSDVLNALRQKLGDSIPPTAPLRLMEVYSSKIFKVCDPHDRVDAINDQYWSLRAEVVPSDQVQLVDGERIIPVCHVTPDKDQLPDSPLGGSLFGDPFLMKISDSEPLYSVKRRIQQKLELSDEEISTWRFAIMPSVGRTAEWMLDSEFVASKFSRSKWGGTPAGEANYLGMAHEDKNPRRHFNNRTSFFEKPVKIYS